MGSAFALGAAVPVLPFLLTTGLTALLIASVATGVVLFAIGATKARWTGRPWVRSGLEVLVLAAIAGVAGYLFGSVLPDLFGFAA